MGLDIICIGGGWLGNLVDFMIILLTGKNMPDDSNGLWGILSWMWLPPIIILAMYIYTSLLIPEKKWYIISIFLVWGIVFEFFVFLDIKGSVIFIYPETAGEDLIDENFIYTSPLGILYTIAVLVTVIFGGFGFFFKGVQSADVIRKKFFILSAAIFMFSIFGILDAINSGFILVFARIGVLCSMWFFYLGLREESDNKTEKLKPKKEIKVKEDLFRISQIIREDITEEEVSISKEKKICLVCKGKVLGINFICTECEAFYCMKCANALSNIENACWACGAPIDESRPVKPFKKEEKIEILEKPHEKPNITKK